MLDEKLVPVEALRELNIPGQKSKRKGAKLDLPEATVKILEVGENASVKRVVNTTVNKTTTGDAK
jgi:hypothetical protein